MFNRIRKFDIKNMNSPISLLEDRVDLLQKKYNPQNYFDRLTSLKTRPQLDPIHDAERDLRKLMGPKDPNYPLARNNVLTQILGIDDKSIAQRQADELAQTQAQTNLTNTILNPLPNKPMTQLRVPEMDKQRIQKIGANTQNFTPIPEGKLNEPIEDQLAIDEEAMGNKLSALLMKRKNPLFNFFGFG